jgi:hypothetical protein
MSFIIQPPIKNSKIAILTAVAAVALNFSALTASANTVVTLTSNGTEAGTFSGLTGVVSQMEEDTYNISGLTPTGEVTSAFLFPTATPGLDTWAVSNNNGWLIIDAPGGATAAVIHFDNETTYGGAAYETLFYYTAADLPPLAEYDYTLGHPPDDTVTITENAAGYATYDPTSGEAGYGYNATGTTPSSTGTQLDFVFHTVPDGANTLCLLGVGLAALAGIRRRFSVA